MFVLPFWVMWTIGALVFEDITFFLKIDYSNSQVQMWLAQVALLGLIQSALIKFMIWARKNNQR